MRILAAFAGWLLFFGGHLALADDAIHPPLKIHWEKNFLTISGDFPEQVGR